jgi:anthranilate phosphoribosyltransferase
MTTQEEILKAYWAMREIGFPADDVTIGAFESGAVAVMGVLTDLFKGPDLPSIATVSATLLQLNDAVGNLKKAIQESGG